jgi:glucosamine--fructose-6-phosphate aminotransferase (isomerizing)
MCGIFGFCNFRNPYTRRQIAEKLITGLRRLEYRGYDSAGLAIDAGTDVARDGPIIIKEQGNIDRLIKCVSIMT